MAERSTGWMDFTSERDREAAEITGPDKWAAVKDGWKQDEQRKKEKAGD